MLPIALSLLGGGAVYLITKIASGAGPSSRTAAPLIRPGVPPAVVLRPTPAPATRPEPEPEPAPLPIESRPPPAAVPPHDTAPATLPTPRVVAPPQMAEPPLVERPIVAPPIVVRPPPLAAQPAPREPEPEPLPIETKPPPAAVPPVDTAPAALPTPKVDVPAGPVIDVHLDPANVVPARGAPQGGPPAGFDAALASTLAPGLAAHIRSAQYDFDRARLRAFQTAAGLTPDGIYGNDTWGALLYFTSAAPKALYQPSTPTPYPWGPSVRATAAPAPQAPPAARAEVGPTEVEDLGVLEAVQAGPQPPAGFNAASARKLAKQVAANLDSKGRSYSTALLKQFQTAAGLTPDGLYGGGSRRALIFYGVPRPAQPLFKPTATPASYPWEAAAS